MSLTRGLVGHWSLDDESYNPATKRFTDKSAYNNHGTSANAASFVADRMGQSNRAMSFNGSSDYVVCGNGDSLNITDEITVAAWIKRIGSGVNWQAIVDKTRGSSAQGGYAVYVNRYNEIDVYMSSGDGISSPTFVTNAVLPGDQWMHVVFAREGSGNIVSGDIKVYFNNIIQTGVESNYGKSCGSNNLDMIMGTYNTSMGTFNGSIDNVRIYNRTLAEEEITLLYESYRPKTIIV